MRLTVGPLPAAVYWRRRVVVLVAVAIVALIISYVFGGTGTSNAGPQAHTGTSRGTTTLLHPTSGSPKPTATKPAGTPTPTPFSLSSATTTATDAGPCTDSEMSLTVNAVPTQAQRDAPVSLTITMTNVSDRTCSRDVGADVQEIRLLDGTAIIWSSDDCSPNRGHDIRSFGPGKGASFTLNWLGRRSRSGTGEKVCVNAPLPNAQPYQLVGRLDQKLSDPVTLQIRA